jgi:protein-S-isoprenylcysteine O-methyltransferase Ste14
MVGAGMREKKGEHPFGDTGQLILLGVFLIVWAGDSFFLRKSTFLSTYMPLYSRLVIAVLALGTAFYLFGSGHVVVHHESRPDGLVTTGTFRYVRHPLYLASILTYLGLTVLTVSLFSLALMVVIIVFYDYISGYEERLLEKKYTEEYKEYKKITGKWVPRIRRNR